MGLGLADGYVFSDATTEYLRWKRWWTEYFANGSTGNVVPVGSAQTDSGTKASVAMTSSLIAGSSYTTTASTGAVAGTALDAIHSRGHYIRSTFQFTVTTTATIRYSLGFSDAALATQLAGDTPAQNYFGFRRSTGVPDTNWQCVADNGSGTPTVVDSGVAFAAGEYIFSIVTDPQRNLIYYFSNGVIVATISTTLPATSVVTLRPYIGIATLANSAAAFTLRFLNGRVRVGNT